MSNFSLFISQHWLLCVATLVVFFALMWEEAKAKSGMGRAVDAVALTRMMNQESAAVIDIRPGSEYDAGHIVSSVSYPLADLQAKPKKLKAYQSRPVILVCERGLTATKALPIVREHGIENAYFLKGGMRAWRSANMPITTEKGKKHGKR